MHFLVQSVPSYSPTKIVQMIKSITTKKLFILYSEVKEKLWGGELWTKGYFVNTVNKHGNESAIINDVKNQGKKEESYDEIYKQQLLFE